jgi:hypothetical protein
VSTAVILFEKEYKTQRKVAISTGSRTEIDPPLPVDLDPHSTRGEKCRYFHGGFIPLQLLLVSLFICCVAEHLDSLQSSVISEMLLRPVFLNRRLAEHHMEFREKSWIKYLKILKI